MLSTINTFVPKTVNGTLKVDNIDVNINVTETSICATAHHSTEMIQFISITLNNESETISVSFTGDSAASVLPLVTKITESLKAIKTELEI